MFAIRPPDNLSNRAAIGLTAQYSNLVDEELDNESDLVLTIYKHNSRQHHRSRCLSTDHRQPCLSASDLLLTALQANCRGLHLRRSRDAALAHLFSRPALACLRVVEEKWTYKSLRIRRPRSLNANAPAAVYSAACGGGVDGAGARGEGRWVDKCRGAGGAHVLAGYGDEAAGSWRGYG